MIKAQPCSRESSRWGSLRGLQVLLKLSEHGGIRSSHSVHEDLQGVAQPVKRSRMEDPVIGKCEQTLSQGEQMGGEVPAVHG